MRSLKLSAWGTNGNGWRELTPYTSNICQKKKKKKEKFKWRILYGNLISCWVTIRIALITSDLISSHPCWVTIHLALITSDPSSKYSKDIAFLEATYNTESKAKHAMLSFGLKEGSFNTSGKHFSTVYLSFSIDSTVNSAKPVYWFGQLK